MIYQNVIDLSQALNRLDRRGVKVYKEDVAALSPYLTRHIRRFGEYSLDLTQQPEPFDGKLEAALYSAALSETEAKEAVSS